MLMSKVAGPTLQGTWLLAAYEKNIKGWGGLVITKLKILRGALQDIRNASRYINRDSKLHNNKQGFKAECSFLPVFFLMLFKYQIAWLRRFLSIFKASSACLQI